MSSGNNRGSLKGHRVSVHLSATLGVFASISGAVSFAQGQGAMPAASERSVPAAEPATPESLEVIEVTASRINSVGFSAPSPTTVITAEMLENLQATSVAQITSESPAFKATISPAANGVRTQLPGSSLADLRGLGSNRTLVLVDGLRVVPQAPANNTGVGVSPDLNQIPSLLVDRIEVVTGGASAQWGSDAVAGVMNVILRNQYEGLTVKLQGGESQEGDSRTYRFGMLGGRNFADGAVHLVAGLDYTNYSGLGDVNTRSWGRQNYQLLANPSPSTNGLPANILSPGVLPTSSPGGLITGPANFAFNRYAFNPDGSLSPFQYGSLAGGSYMIGGQGSTLATGVSMAPSVERVDPYVRLSYTLNDHVTLFTEASYSWLRGQTYTLPSRDSADIIRASNPYLPANVAAAMTTAGIPTFSLSRINYDVGGNALVTVENKTPHIAVGGNGAIAGSWTWDAHLAWGQNRYTNSADHDRIRSNYTFATDAVLNNGQIVCRATVPGTAYNSAAAGCVPIDLFGAGAPSAAAIDYVTATAHSQSTYTQDSAAANVRGEAFDDWAGPVALAAGLEYRRETQTVLSDPIAAAGGYETANASAFSGSFNVKEGYVETEVPLLRNLSFAKAMDLNAAVRVADYSSVGSETTWKGGLTYEPVSGLRFRATRSRDIRAPALFELDSPGAISTLSVAVKGRSSTIPTNTTVGNPDLRPESADTTTYGAVITPGFVPGLTVSVDRYDINLKNAITSLTAASIAGLCNLGQTEFCNAFSFNATGVPTGLVLPVLNAASVRTKGVDFALSYRADLGQFVFRAPGSVTVRLDTTWTQHTLVNLGFGSATIDRAGENSQLNTYAMPSIRSNLTATYSVGAASFTAQGIFTSSGKIDNTYNSSTAVSINENGVPAVTYLNLFASYELDKNGHFQVFGSVNNVLNKDPPPVPSTILYTPTNGAYYDIVGRAFMLGVTWKL